MYLGVNVRPRCGVKLLPKYFDSIFYADNQNLFKIINAKIERMHENIDLEYCEKAKDNALITKRNDHLAFRIYSSLCQLKSTSLVPKLGAT